LGLVLVLPNIKRQKEGKEIFDEEGVNVFISQNCWNEVWSGISYMLNLPNGFWNPARKSTNC